MPHKAQGCAGWARNPKGPQITPFCHQLGRHPTVLDATSAGFRQISARRSLGGSRPLNLNFFVHHFGAKKCQNPIFWDIFENGHPQPGRIWVPKGPLGPKGPMGAPWGPGGPQWGPMGPPWGPWGIWGPQGPWGSVPPSWPCSAVGKAREGRLHWYYFWSLLIKPH